MNWEKRFENIYGTEAAKQWIPKLRDRIETAKQLVSERTGQNRIMKMEENSNRETGINQNVILITYPDQISEDESRLITFGRFAGQYLKDVFDVIHFLPFCPYSSDDGFSVIDYKELAQGLGSWEDLQRIAENFTLMYDFVCNHVSAKSQWFQKCLQGDKQYEKYFIEGDPQQDTSMVIRPRTSPLFTPFLADGKKKYFWTTFSDDQIDLNYENPEVLYEALDVFLFYLEQGGSWIRLDAVGFLWKEAGTSCMHHEKTHEVIKLMRSVMDEVNPSGRIVTETNVPHAYNISYFGNGTDESHMVYQFPLPMLVLYSFYKQNAGILSSWAKGLKLPTDKTGFFNFLASHDGIGLNPVRSIVPDEEIEELVAHLQKKCGALVSYKENQDGSKSAYEVNVSYFSALKEDMDFERAKQRFLTAHAVLLGMPGDPAIYIHSYLGSENDTEGVRRTGMNRTINREKFTYGELLGELADVNSQREQIRASLENMIRVRKGCDAFNAHAPQEVLEGPEELFLFLRKGNKETVLCLHNFSDRTVEMQTPAGVNLLTGEEIRDRVKIPPYGFIWISI